MTRLAVIPARGGSKRIPRKNVKPFAGKPMIVYAIDAAREAAVFDHIVVSTDDDEIAAVAQAHGALVPFRRPADLANDHAATSPVLVHAIAQALEAGWDVQQVCCIYPGVPLLLAQDLRDALVLLDEGLSDFVFPVLAFESAVQRAMKRDAQGRMQPMYPAFTMTRTQDLEPAYHDAGQFYWGTVAGWQSGRSAHAGGRSIVLPPERAVDIDTPEDWARAEALFAAVRANRPA
jgi:pseudaminic acid cytidylyltransferase